MVVLDSEGMEHAVNQDSLAHDLVREGRPVLLADLPGIGSMGPGYLKGDSFIDSTSYNQWFAAVLSGKSNVGLRAEDIVRIIHFARTDLNDFSGITVLAVGALGSEVLHAALFEPGIQNVCLIRSFLSYADIASTRFYNPEYVPFTVPGAISEYDLPDLMAGLCPRRVLILEPLSGDGLIADEAKAKKSMLFPSRVYSEKGVPGNFNLVSGLDDQTARRGILESIPEIIIQILYTIKRSFFSKYLLPGFVFQSVIIGGGYGTARELVEYFLKFGPIGGLLGMLLITTIVWSVFLALTFEFTRLFRTFDYRTFFKELLGPFWPGFDLIYLSLLIIILAVLGSASGILLRDNFGVPYFTGVIFMLAGVGIFNL